MNTNNSSCNFIPKGNSMSECYNTCISDNTGDCVNYCNQTCSSCSDKTSCLWLKSKSNNNLNQYLTMYNELTNKIISYQTKQGNLYNSANDSNSTPQINLSKNINDLKIKRNILWNYLVNEYNYNTQLTEANYNAIRNSNKNIKTQKKIIKKNNESLDSLQNLTNTKKRQIIINKNKFKKLQLQVKLLQIFAFLVLVGLSVIYFLKKGIIQKKPGLIIYCGYVSLLLIVFGVYYYEKTKIKDDVQFSDSNFGKPDKKEVGTDNLLSKMDDKTKQKCLAISDALEQQNFNPDNIDIGFINRYVNDTTHCKKVMSNTKFNDIYNSNS